MSITGSVCGTFVSPAAEMGAMSLNAASLAQRQAQDQCREPRRQRTEMEGGSHHVDLPTSAQWRIALDLIEKHVPFGRRKVSPTEAIYTYGKELESLYVIYTGSFRIECTSSDGRAVNAEILLNGDWLGFDAISTGHHVCTAIAVDFAEVWVVNYQALLRASALNPALLSHVVSSISQSLGRSRDQMLSNGSLPADRRVADFLLRWALNLSEHGRRTDLITVPLTRAEIGSLLGMRIETVSRALSHLADMRLINFDSKYRRQFSIPDLEEVRAYVHDQDVVRAGPTLSSVWT